MKKINFKIAEKYRNKNELANLMGFILYTDKNPFIKKLLRDNDYWKALDKISGKDWAIFAIKPDSGDYEIPISNENSLSMMVPVWKEPKSNLKLLKEFGLKDTSDLPMLLIVSQNDNGEILKCEFHLDETNENSVYNSLKEGIEVVSNELKYIKSKFKNNDTVYINVKGAIEHNLIWKKIHKGVKYVSWLKDWIVLAISGI